MKFKTLLEAKNKLVIDNSDGFIAFMLNPFSTYRKNLLFDIVRYVDSKEWKKTYLNTKGGRKYSTAVREFVKNHKPSEMYVRKGHKDGDPYYHDDSIEVMYRD